MRRTVIVKESQVKLMVHQEYIELKSPTQSRIIAFRHIEALYLNKAIKIPIGHCYQIMEKVPFFLIDEHGYILAQFVEV